MRASDRTELKQQLKSAVIRASLEGFYLAGRAGLAGSARGAGVIFTLHHVRPEMPEGFAPNAHLTVTPDFLDVAIVTLLEDGYRPAALEDLPRLLAHSEPETRYFAFTLDDGYRDSRDHALPVFRRHNVPFTVFVTKGFSERTCSIWWGAAERLLRETSGFVFDFSSAMEHVPAATQGEKRRAFERLAAAIRSPRQDQFIERLEAAAWDAGIDPMALTCDLVMDAGELAAFAQDPLVTLGAHSLTHASLAQVDAGRLARELAGSADYVEQIVGRRPKSFAFPYGDAHAAGPREFKAAQDAGFDIAVTTRPGVLSREAMLAAPTALNRVSLNGRYQKPRYVRALASGLAFRFT